MNNKRIVYILIFIFILINFNCTDKAGKEKKGDYFYEIAGKLESSLKGDVSKIDLYLDNIKKVLISDPFYIYFNLEGNTKNGTLTITGDVERKEHKNSTIKILNNLGFRNIKFNIGIVPDREHLKYLFGIIKTPYSFMTSAAGNKEPMDECLYGEPVYILKEAGDFFLIKNFSGYWGYAKKSTIRTVDKEFFAEYINKEKVILTDDIKTGNGVFIPKGSLTVLKSWGDTGKCTLLSVDNSEIIIEKKKCIRSERKAEMEMILSSAGSYLNTVYNLGGKNSETGIDCSGLVQYCFRTIGINLPRDAKQQYLSGNLVATGYFLKALKPGDALFFLNSEGKIAHTGIYIGNNKMIHATSYDKFSTQIHSIIPSDEDYNESFHRTFLGAKRIFK